MEFVIHMPVSSHTVYSDPEYYPYNSVVYNFLDLFNNPRMCNTLKHDVKNQLPITIHVICFSITFMSANKLSV